ncbi:MAG: lytic murein transglycosylase B [Zetaproteobacteria bacterium]|nr:MAG: lytic murein transglycosylase B [Zetaproteobacteria bacterium]
MRGVGAAVAAVVWAPEALRADPRRAALVDALVRQTGLPRAEVAAALTQARYRDSVIRRITTPYEARPYAAYRPLFVRRRLADQGRAYLREHAAVFAAARARYHVQPEMIAAILGMESHYGRRRGRDRVLDALYTLAVGYPRRADFFRRELGEFLLMCHEERRDPASVVGSYAGAFGTTQFIPSSYRAYAVDGDGDGRRDVWDSPTDIIYSVANYFHRHHWDDRRPVAHWLPEGAGRRAPIAALIAARSLRWRALADLRPELGRLPAHWRDDDRVTVIALAVEEGVERPLLIHYNFHVITRWNRSRNYAMAATELAAMLGSALCAVS